MSSPTPASTYTMEDLTTLAGVTARTVRYYIAEGLLPPPVGAGPATSYDDAHRNRLLLIGILKDAYLPLKEIRRRLAAMSEQEIADAVAERLAPDGEPPPDFPQRRTHLAQGSEHATDAAADATIGAAAYIDRVLQAQLPSLRRGSPRPHPASSPIPTTMPGPVSNPADRLDDAATWKRLSITPEAELLIEQEAYRRRREQVDAALDWLRRILNGS